MLKFHITLTALVLFLIPALAFAQSDILVWNGSSEELEKYINSKNENKIVFALQKVILNPELTNTHYFAHEIYMIYRNHSNEKIRQMALVALFKSKQYYLLKNLKDDLYKEKNIQIRKQIYSILEKMPVLSELH